MLDRIAFDQWWADLHFSWRLLAKAPGRTAVLLMTLASGIAMSAALFGVLRAVVFNPLPFQHADQLVVLHQANGEAVGGVSYPHYRDWKAGASSFTDLAVFSSGESTVSSMLSTTEEPAERVTAATVSANLFSILHVAPLRGRLFRSGEDRLGGGEGGERAALVSESFWRGHLGAREDIAGQHLEVDGFRHRIVGVIPSRFSFPVTSQPISVWTTVAVDAEPTVYGGSIPESRGYPRYDGVLARLRPGSTIANAKADMKRLAAAVARAHAGATSMNDVVVRPALDDLVGSTRHSLLLLYGAVIAVLLVACANASTLLMVTALSRREEFGIRTALGAPPARLLRQVLFENACLGFGSGVLALPFAWALVCLCVALAPPDTPRIMDAGVDSATFIYALTLALAAGVLAGALPALISVRSKVVDNLRAASRSTSDSKAAVRMSGLLILGQIAVCMVLTCCSSLLTRSFINVLQTPRGFNPHSIVTATVDLPVVQYPQGSDRVRNFYRSLVAAIGEQPQINAVTIAERLPLSGSKNSTTVKVLGRDEPGLPATDLRFTDDRYFDTLRIPLVSGRLFTSRDDAGRTPVVLVNRAFVRRYLQDIHPEGQLLKLGWGGSAPKQVIGVVADLKNQALDLVATPEVYVPALQFPNNSMAIMIRTGLGKAEAGEMLRHAVAKVDRTIPVDRIRTLDEYLLLSASTQRFVTAVLLIFSVSTVVIAAIGIYGLLSYSTVRRTREFGIRMALGSHPAQLLRLVLRQGVMLAAAGVAIGALLSVAETGYIAEWLYETERGDWFSFVVPAVVLFAAALAASYVPARRASQVDPLLAIRAE